MDRIESEKALEGLLAKKLPMEGAEVHLNDGTRLAVYDEKGVLQQLQTTAIHRVQGFAYLFRTEPLSGRYALKALAHCRLNDADEWFEPGMNVSLGLSIGNSIAFGRFLEERGWPKAVTSEALFLRLQKQLENAVRIEEPLEGYAQWQKAREQLKQGLWEKLYWQFARTGVRLSRDIEIYGFSEPKQ